MTSEEKRKLLEQSIKENEEHAERCRLNHVIAEAQVKALKDELARC